MRCVREEEECKRIQSEKTHKDSNSSSDESGESGENREELVSKTHNEYVQFT